MAEDDQDRARETEAEREAEIEEEMKRVGEDPDQVQDGESTLGKQSAESGEVREETTSDEQAGDETETMQEEAQELPNEQQREQWEQTGGDEELAGEATGDDEDSDEVGDEAPARPSYEERNVEGKEYAEHEMRGTGASGAMTDEGSGDEAVPETRPDREEPTATALELDDVGTPVVDADGNEIGVVAQASREDGAVHVDVNPGITERILSKLGWTGEEDVDHVLPPERIRSVTDDRVVVDTEAERFDDA